MSVLRRVKLRTPDGTESIEYPLGVDAENVEVANQENLSQRLVRIDEDLEKNEEDIAAVNELAGTNKQNIGANEIRIDALERRSASVDKKPYYFDTVADMKAYQELKAGDMAVTLGYYEPNDGGASKYKIVNSNDKYYEKLNNNLKAELIIENETVNIKQLGAKGNGSDDDTTFIQTALNKYLNIFVPSGSYKITSKLTMRFNTKLIGNNRADTFFIADKPIESSYILEYGSKFNYGEEAGVIKGICFKSENSRYSYGVIINSGIIIEDCYFLNLKQAISKSLHYIDVIKIIRTTIAYCNNTEKKYIIDFSSNSDGLYINQLKVITSYNEDTFNEYMGIHLSMCQGGSINNSIINCPLIIDNCKAFSVNNTHFEGDSDRTPNNLSFIKINKSNVSLNDNYMHKRSNGSNIIINSDYSSTTHNANSIIINNFTILYTPGFIDLIKDFSNIYDIEKGTNSILQLKNCFVSLDYSAGWQITTELYGIRIKDLPEFNKHSSMYSFNSIIGLNNNIISELPTIKSNSGYTTDQYMQYSGASENIAWYEEGFNNKTQYYQSIYVIDEDRKLALCRTTNGYGCIVKGITTGSQNSETKKGVLLRNTRSIIADGIGCTLYIYRGDSVSEYNKLTKVPSCSANYLFDMGTNISGYPTIDRTASDLDTFNYVSNFKLKGNNVSFYASSYPTIGTFKKYDRCINTSITAGGIKS